MRVPISWLREFVALPDDPEAIAERLAMLGFPVDGIERRPKISGVVTGRIERIEKHPNADRLLVGRVDVGAGEPLTIATAATNVASGQHIAVATVGARLPELRIEARTMRGVASQGMMISANELALPPEWFEDGIMQLESAIEPGLDVVELFGLDTAVLDVEITANRPDAMSVIGLARELAASYGVPLTLPSFANPGEREEPPGKAPQVSIESPDCRRFIAQRFDGVRVQAAPAWMRVRLAMTGQRPISNLVDVSNYVMLETGQPLHFYDADKIAGMTLVVRDARAGETLRTLDDVERTLGTHALVIADRDRALGLAGLMGGASSEVTPATSSIVLESANFIGARVRRMSAALGLRTEASGRHEKSLAPALTDIGAARAAQLLCDFGASACRPREFGTPLGAAAPIPLQVRDVERLLGLTLPANRIAAHLTALGCGVSAQGDGAFAVVPPPWRRDLTLATDLVEEVARVEGYERIAAVVPSVPAHEISSAKFSLENRVAHALAALGYSEVITHSLRPSTQFIPSGAEGLRTGPASGEAGVEVRNPLSEEQRFLRTSLVPGLLEYLAGVPVPSHVFELGQIFYRVDDKIVEQTAIAFGFSAKRGSGPAWRDSSFLRLKGDCEALVREVTGKDARIAPGTRPDFHPGKTAAISIDGVSVGVLGCIDPRLSKAHDLDGNGYFCIIGVDALPPYTIPRYRPPSRFPSTYRDLALVLSIETAAGDVEEAVASTLGPLCVGARVFDEYRGPQAGEGRKSLALRVTLQRFDATITDEEADAAIARVLDALRERFGASLRA